MPGGVQGQAAASRLEWYRELYDRVAWSYDFEDNAYPFYCNEQSATLRLLNQCVPAVGAGEERWALDLGCGPGQYSVWLLERGYHVMGVDISSNMIEAARRATRAYHERVVFREGDLMTLPVPGERFSVAIAFGSLVNHLDDWVAFFRRVSPLLNREGLLLFDVDNILGLHQVLYLAYTHLRRMPGRPTARGLLQRIVANLRGATYQTVLPIETAVGLLDLPLTYGSLSLMQRVTAAADMEIIARLGANTLAALLPGTTLSVSYRTRADGVPASWLERLLASLDEALAAPLVGVAGLQFLVCRKRLTTNAVNG
jgi:SAM-dependent methyltransferase